MKATISYTTISSYPAYYPWIIWIVALGFVLLQFTFQLSTGEIVNGLMQDFHLTALGGGVLASAYYYVYVLLQAPAGMLIDRFGARRLLSVGAVVVALGCAMFASTHYLLIAILSRVIVGAGAAFAFVGLLRLIRKWFVPHRFGLMVGISETVGMTGSIIGTFGLATSLSVYGWRHAMMIAAIIACVLAILLWIFVRDAPKKIVRLRQFPRRLFIHRLARLFASRRVWLNGLYSGLMFSVVSVFAALWAVPFLQVQHHLSLLYATGASDLVFIGVALGCPLIGWLDSRFLIRRYLLIALPIVAACLLACIVCITNMPVIIFIVILLMLGLSVSSYMLNFVVADEITPPMMRSTHMGIVNMLSIGTAPIMQPLVGLLLALMARHAGVSVHSYVLLDYQIALLPFFLALILAAWIGCYILKPVESPAQLKLKTGQ